MSTFNSPLLGDGQGNYRIHLIGNSGTGKSTLAAYLSAKLNLPHISLDGLAWNPGWQRLKNNEFKEKVSALMVHNTQGWIVDGNYIGTLGTLISDNATDIICENVRAGAVFPTYKICFQSTIGLDPPLRHYLPRVTWRTFLRILGLYSPCAEGCRETWKEIFTREGVVWCCITNHAVKRAKYMAWLTQMSIDTGGKMRRLDETRGELARWKDDLEAHLRRM